MQLDDLLIQHQVTIQQRWLELIIASYPVEAQGFFQKQKNRFLNPVGAAIAQQVEELFEGLLKTEGDPELGRKLDEFVKIRAVQDFPPGQAIGFILTLKQAVREELTAEIHAHQLFGELLALETRIDQILLSAFDVYMGSREKIYEIRANELKRRAYLALRQLDYLPVEREHFSDSHD